MVAPQNIFASVQECQLRARVEVEESYGGMADLNGSPKTVRFVGLDQADLDHRVSNYTVHSDVVANGVDPGEIRVTLNGVDSQGRVYPVLGAEDRLAASTSGGYGMSFWSFVDHGDGEYSAGFTSSVAGDFPVTVTIDGAALRPSAEGAGTAHILEAISDRPSVLYSSASASTGVVPASYPPAHPGAYDASGLHSVDVALRQALGSAALENHVAGLSWSYAGNDPYLGEGLFSVLGFQPAESGSGQSAQARIGSTKPGVRRIVVTYYQDFQTDFKVANAADPNTVVLELEFGPHAADFASSTVVVSPSLPEDNPDDPNDKPDGVPTPLVVGEEYDVVITGWTKGRQDRGVAGQVGDVPTFGVWLHSDDSACGFVEEGVDPQAPWDEDSRAVVLDEDGRFSIKVRGYEAGACVLDVWGVDPALGPVQLDGSPKTLHFVASDVDLDNADSWFTVSNAPVAADGNSTGTVTVQLVDANGIGLTDQRRALEASASASSGVTVGAFEHLGDGVYRAYFTGVQAGDYPINVKVSGLSVGVKENGNAEAHLREATVRVGDESKSWASITTDPGQAGVMGKPGAWPGVYGQQTITATVLDADGQPITSAAGKLSLALAAAYDPGGDWGYSNDGFSCAEDLVDGECVNGVYTIDVYSGVAASRVFHAVYRDGDLVFRLTNKDAEPAGAKELTALFTTGPASAQHSTLRVDPDPKDGPIEPGNSFTAAVRVTDAFDNPVSGEELTFELDGDADCPAWFDDPLTEPEADHSLNVKSSATGQATVSLTGRWAGVCGLSVYLASDLEGLEPGDPAEAIGFAELAWNWDGPAADPTKSTVVITPSDPAGDPAGDPTPISSDESYTVQVTAYGADGITPAPGAALTVKTLNFTGYSCMYAVIESDAPGWDPNWHTARTDQDGAFEVTISAPDDWPGVRACHLEVWLDGQLIRRYDAEGNDHLAWPMVWLDPPDLASEHTFYQVTEDEVPANGENLGFVEVQLRATLGMSAMVDLAKLKISAPAGSGLEFGDFEEVPRDEDDPWHGIVASGVYRVAFAGAVGGDWSVTVAYGDVALNDGEDHKDYNRVAHMVGGEPPRPVGAESESSAWITAKSAQAGVYGADGAQEGDWGKQTITVEVLDADRVPVVDAAGKLSVRADETYDLGGGLAYSDGGVFVCADKLVEDECVAGVYTVEVYSGAPVNRVLNVVYEDGDVEFLLSNRDAELPGVKQLVALFTTGPASAEHSTVTYEPDPEAGPLRPGESFTATARITDAFGNPVSGQMVSFVGDDHGDNPLRFDDPENPGELVEWLDLETGETGVIVVTMTAERAGICEMDVYLEDPWRWFAVALLVWEWDGPKADASKTSVVITPSDPAGDPTPIYLDEAYEFEITTYGADGVTPAPGAMVSFLPNRFSINDCVLYTDYTTDSPTWDGDDRAGRTDEQGKLRVSVAMRFGVTRARGCYQTVRVEDEVVERLDAEGSSHAPAFLYWAVRPVPGVGYEGTSWASITTDPGQAGVYDPDGGAEGQWGKQTITVGVMDLNGDPVTDADEKLDILRDQDYDPGTDASLYASNGYWFVCAEEPVDGACVDGVYTIDVYSSVPGARVVNVVYDRRSIYEFLLSNRDAELPGVKQLVALFTTGLASAEHSTLTVDPEEGPIKPGEAYTVTARVTDALGDPVYGEPVTFSLDRREGCAAQFEGEEADTLEITRLTSARGLAQAVLVSPNYAGECAVYAWLGDEESGQEYINDGDGVDLFWEWPPGWGVDPSKTTVVITPSDPAGDPAGVPSVLPFALDQVYEVEVSAYDEDGEPVPGAEVYLDASDVEWGWMCAVSITLEGQTGGGSPYLIGQTGADGKLRATVQNLEDYVFAGVTRVCDFKAYVGEDEVLRYGEPEDPEDYPLATLLAWLSPPDTEHGLANYQVSEDPVDPDGSDSGTIDLQLWAFAAQGGGPALVDPSKLEVKVPDDSGLKVSEFEPLAWEDEYMEYAYGPFLPSGFYQATFTGTAPGQWPIEIYYDGVLLPTEGRDGDPGNDIAHVAGGDSPPGVSAHKSVASVTRTAGQPANHDAPNSLESDWGRQTISVTLVDDDERPVTDGAAALSAAASADDSLDGIGLYFGNGGAFACAEALVDRACAGGVYVLDVYSSKAGEREVEVVHGAGTADEFTLANAGGAASLTTPFTVPPLDRLASTVVIIPSTPGDDPDDPLDDPASQADTLDWGETYTVVVTTWDAGRNNRVPNTPIRVSLTHQHAPYRYCTGGEIRYGGNAAGNMELQTSTLGRVEFTVATTEPGSKCKLEVWPLEWPEPGRLNQFSGSGRNLNWNDPEPDPALSAYFVDEEPVVANGYDFGMISVNLLALVGDEASGVGADPSLLTAWAEDSDSEIEISSFAAKASSSVGWYQAYFSGTAPGDWTIKVAWDGVALTAEEGSDVAHLVVAAPPVPAPAQSSVRLVTAERGSTADPRATYADALADVAYDQRGYFHIFEIELLDADGDPIEDAAGALSLGLADSDPYGPDSFFAGDNERIGQPGQVSELGGGLYEVEVASFKPGARQFKVTFSANGSTFDLVNAEAPTSTAVTAAYLGRDASAEHSKLVVNPSTPTDLVTDLTDPADGVPDALAAGERYEILFNLRDRDALVASRHEGAGDLADVRLVAALSQYSGLCESADFYDESGEILGHGSWASVETDPLTGIGKVFVTSDAAAICQLIVRTQSYVYTGQSNLLGSPKTLRWLALGVDPEQADTWFEVSSDPVAADGATPGLVTVSLRDADGQPLTTAWGAIRAEAVDGDLAGLSFGVFSHVGGGVYEAAFTGTVPGAHLVTVTADGAGLNVKPGANAYAHLTASAVRVASEAKSWATITTKANQAGVFGAEGAVLGDWGWQTITAAVLDADGAPMTEAAGDLSLRVAESPQLGDWAYSSGGFVCADGLVDGECVDGVYKVDVYSAVPVDRSFSVAYSDGEAEFLLSVRDADPASKVLVALFTTGPASADHSLLTVSPAEPVKLGETLNATVDVRDRFGNAVVDAVVRFDLGDVPGEADCPVSFEDMDYIDLTSDELGSAEVKLTSDRPGRCELWVFVGGAWLENPAVLEWTWLGPPPDPSQTTVVVTPSIPADDPAGVPTPVLSTDAYQVEITVYDETGLAPVQGARVYIDLRTYDMMWPAMCVVSPEGATGDSPYLTGWTDAEGKLRVNVEAEPQYQAQNATYVCDMIVYVEGQAVKRQEPTEAEPLPLTHLVFLSPPDVDASGTFYGVSDDVVDADGDDAGTIDIRLWSLTGPGLVDLSKLTISAPPDSGLEFGPVKYVPLTESQKGYGVMPSAAYQVSFTGTAPGDWPIKVYYDGVLLGTEDLYGEDLNATAHMVSEAPPPARVASEGASWASVTAWPGQAGVFGAEGAVLGDWGWQTITAAVLDADGAPMSEAAGGLSLRVAESPQLGGWAYSSDGFVCADGLVDGECVDGVYEVDVYSAVPVGRSFSVAYSGGGVEFLLSVRGADPVSKVLVASFTTGPASAADSEFVVSPESPVGLGESFGAAVTVFDAFGNLVVGESVRFALSGSGCPASFGGEPTAAVSTDELGVAEVSVVSAAAGTCALSASLGGGAGAVLGAGVVLTWQAAPPPVVSAVLSVEPGSAVADGSQTRVVVVSVQAGGSAVVGARVWFSVPVGVSADSTSGPAVVEGVTEADGRALLALTSVVAGPHWVSVVVDGVGSVSGSPLEVVFDPVPAPPPPVVLSAGLSEFSVSESSSNGSPGVVLADGSESFVVSVAARGSDGAGYGGAGGVVSLVPAGGGVPAEFGFVADGSGSASVVVVSSAAGSFDVSVVLTGAGPVATSPGGSVFAERVVFDPVPAPPAGELLAPKVNPSNGQRVVGSVQGADLDDAAAGSLLVVVTDDATDVEIVRCPVGVDGAFDCALPNLGHETYVWVRIETDPSNASPQVHLIVDAVAPVPGNTTPSDGAVIGGLGEAAGHGVVVWHADGSELCRAQVASDISWTCDLQPEAAEGDLVTIAHTDHAGNTAQVTWRVGVPQVNLDRAQVNPGERQRATGVNFQPGESVTAVMRSDPVALGTVVADADGTVTFEWTVPANIDPGQHQVELTGQVSGAYSAGFQVAGANPPASSGAATPTSTASKAGGGLGVTGGVSVGTVAPLGLGLLIVGCLMVLAARRRRAR
ncbi:MAG: hypothetical protein LBD77_05160 [Bifidobacteriaceae bacterium]|jgi:hypothetical protein|nr:hypothetical protein [Bifidobacteriaceae bacterium]